MHGDTDSAFEPEFVFNTIFPESRRLDAFDIAFDDLAVFEAAGHPREQVAKLSTYGFITWAGMQTFLAEVSARFVADDCVALTGKRFLDLGSGDARTLVAALLQAPMLGAAHGVELSLRRHELALKNCSQLPDALRSKALVAQGDILRVSAEDLASADVIYSSSLHFPEQVVAQLESSFEERCAIEHDVVIGSLRECNFRRRHVAWTQKVAMSWNADGAPVYFYHLFAKP